MAVLCGVLAAEVRVELVDAARDECGLHRFGVLDLLQEQADQKTWIT